MRSKRQYRSGFQFAGLTELARDLRKQETSAEALRWQVLRDRQLFGFKFRRQHQFANYVTDFFCRGANLVIECDGGVHEVNEQWHHNQVRDAYFAHERINVLRFSNNDILNDTARVVQEIARLPSPSGRGAGGEGLSARIKPSPQPSPKGRGR